MKNLVDMLNESLVNEVWFQLSDPEYIKQIRLGKEKERDDNKKAMVKYADKNGYKLDILRSYDNAGNLNEYDDIPVMIIGDPEDKKQLCIAIEMERLELTFRYYYHGACYIFADGIAEQYSDLADELDKIPEIPSSWKRDSYTSGRKGDLLNDFDSFVKKAANFQKRLKL